MLRVLWVDDDEDRREDAAALERRTPGLRVRFARPESISPETASETKYDLALVDIILNALPIPGSNVKFRWQGLTLAAELREWNPGQPIYGFSADGDRLDFVRSVDSQKVLFDKLFSVEQLYDHGAGRALVSDASDYKEVMKAVPTRRRSGGTEAYVRLLRPPESDIEGVTTVVNSDFLVNGESGQKTGMDYARWVRTIFLEVPGPLRGGHGVSAFLGVSDYGFHRIQPALESALYRGVFSETHDRLWWSAKLEDIVARQAKRRGATGGVLSRRAAVAFALKPRDQAFCVVCHEPFPEALGFTSLGTNPAPVHLHCSRHHAHLEDRLHFDEPREYALD